MVFPSTLHIHSCIPGNKYCDLVILRFSFKKLMEPFTLNEERLT